MQTWAVDCWTFGSTNLSEALEQGWEPFAATTDDDNHYIWVRRLKVN